MCLPPAGHNFKIGYKNIQGLHSGNDCKIEEYTKECFNDTGILSETWGCDCAKEFEGYDLLVEIKPQKIKGIKKRQEIRGSYRIGKKISKKIC